MQIGISTFYFKDQIDVDQTIRLKDQIHGLSRVDKCKDKCPDDCKSTLKSWSDTFRHQEDRKLTFECEGNNLFTCEW